jgi:hypothetical protein
MAHIHTNFNFLSLSITKLVKTTNSLSETLKEIVDIQDELDKINGSEADAVKQKFPSYFNKNKGSEVMCEM